MRMDNGPQFGAVETRDFLMSWTVRWRYSSPLYPQSNGHAEAAVKAAKRLLLATSTDSKSDKFLRGLLEWRNTPRSDHLSPAQRLFGHNLRSFLPAHTSSFAPRWQKEAADKLRQSQAEAAKARYDSHSHPLRVLQPGQELSLIHI